MLKELYWLNAAKYWEYLLICVQYRFLQGLIKALISYKEVFIPWNPELRKLRSNDLRVQGT